MAAYRGSFFELDRRFDWNHLNARGSREYTLELARRYLDQLDPSKTTR